MNFFNSLFFLSFTLTPLLSFANPVLIAVIDTGIDLHKNSQLTKYLWTNPGESGLDEKGRSKANNGIDDDNNGFIDDVHGWNFAVNNADLQDFHGHGTHISGLIAHGNLHTNQQSFAAGEIQLMILKYYTPEAKSENNFSASLKAMDYAISRGAKIINYSGGGGEANPIEELLIRKAFDKDILVVAAAGNARQNIEQNGFFPASYNLPNILAVASTSFSGDLASTSNFSSKIVNIATQGENIKSDGLGGKPCEMSGTSQATAIVTGVAAKMLSQNQSLTPQELIRRISTSADSSDFLSNKVKGQRQLNSHRITKMKNSQQSIAGYLKQDFQLPRTQKVW